MDTFVDELLKKNSHTCAHTHTCNPPGPDNAHTHTCYHTHTQIISTEEENGFLENTVECTEKKKRPLGNRQAVRKYREKKKAHTAYLEEEVQKLHLMNQQLLRRLQGQAVLEAEVARLRTLLCECKGKIDSELGIFPYQSPCSGNFNEGNCSFQPQNAGFQVHCDTAVTCPHVPLEAYRTAASQNGDTLPWEGICEISSHDY